jgi:hypothetical protein
VVTKGGLLAINMHMVGKQGFCLIKQGYVLKLLVGLLQLLHQAWDIADINDSKWHRWYGRHVCGIVATLCKK